MARKIKIGKFLPFVFLIVIIVGALFFFKVIPTPFAITGTPSSELLTLSAGQTYFASNDPQAQITGNVAIATFSVGAGNDIAMIGSFEKENVQTPNVPPDYTNPTFYFVAKKEKMDTIINIDSSTTRTMLLPKTALATVQSPLGSQVSSGEDITAQKLMAKGHYQTCKSQSGYMSFGWKAAATIFSNIDNKYYAQIKTICLTREASFSAVKYGKKTTEMDIAVQLINAKNQESTISHLTQSQTSVNLYSGSELVGHVNFAGSLKTFEQTVDISDDAPINYGNTWSNADNSLVNIYRDKLVATINLAEDYSGDISLVQRYDQVEVSKTDLYNSYFTIVNGRTNKIGGYNFTPGANSIIVNAALTENPFITLVAKADWIGIIRNVPEFELTCGGAISGECQRPLPATYANVRNTSNVSGAYTFSYACAGGNRSLMDNLDAGLSRDYTITQSLSQETHSTCVVNLNYAGKTKTCSFALDCTPPIILKEEICGNNIDDDNDGLIDEDCVIPPLCGDNKIDSGEQCDGTAFGEKSCITEGYDGGDLKCSSNCTFNVTNCFKKEEVFDPTLLILAGIAIGVGIVGYLAWRRFK